MKYVMAEEQLKEKLSEIDLEGIVKEELAKNKRFSLYEVSDDILILFNHGERGQSKLHVGFPFPLQSTNYFPNLNNLKLDIFIRGEPMRRIQREMIKDMSTSYVDMNADFSNLIKNKIGKPDRFVYADPYTFIGDSFISLYFIDSFKEAFGVENVVSFSNQSEHLSSIAHCKYYSPEEVAKEVKNRDALIMPDLIDTHWEKTLQTVKEIKGKEVKVIIPGRGLFLDIDKDIKAYHFDGDDTLLRRKNIEDYMAECLSPFGVNGVALSGEKKFHNTSRFFFNPFTSQEIRYISPELVFYTYKNLRDIDKKSEFYLIAGYHKNLTHTNWLNNFLTLLKEDGSMRRISINYYANLSELIEHLDEKECGSILTADTSVSHVANRMGYANVTTYNPLSWDANSLQSLITSSPAGFCRYSHSQMPLINEGFSISDIKYTAKVIAHSLIFFQKSLKEQKQEFENTNLDWLREMYNPSKVTGGIKANEKTKFLCEAAIKVSPLYKMQKLK